MKRINRYLKKSHDVIAPKGSLRDEALFVPLLDSAHGGILRSGTEVPLFGIRLEAGSLSRRTGSRRI